MLHKENPLHVGLCGPLPPPYGGMANQLNQLYEHLVKEGVQVSLVATNAPYPFKIIEKIKGVRAVFRMLPYLLKVWRLAGKVDVIHVFSKPHCLPKSITRKRWRDRWNACYPSPPCIKH